MLILCGGAVDCLCHGESRDEKNDGTDLTNPIFKVRENFGERKGQEKKNNGADEYQSEQADDARRCLHNGHRRYFLHPLGHPTGPKGG